jgi:hypothetical protein
MVSAWLRYERDARSGWWQVENVEQDAERAFPADAPEPLTIRFRPDRVDRTESGGLIVFDFKTSRTPKDTSLWSGERPAEPQLPLYLALLDTAAQPVEGIAFANLAARDKCDLQGTAMRAWSKSFKQPRRGSWEQAVSAWKQRLEALARAYLDGDVRADPRDARTCELCGGHALCRVRESGPIEAVENGEEEE